MEGSKKQRSILIKNVHKSWKEEDIKKELQSIHNQFEDSIIKRFVTREGNVLGTVKVDFKHVMIYQNQQAKGYFSSVSTSMWRSFKPTRTHQFFNCRQFGHPAKWCIRNLKCEYCAGNGHSGNDCILKGVVHNYKHSCCNCNGQHSAIYHNCPI